VAILNAGPFFQAKTLREEACQVDLMLRSCNKTKCHLAAIKVLRIYGR
jgi:hypothetical protein